MLDIIGGISFTAVFALCCTVLIGWSAVGAAERLTLTVTAVLWFAGVAVLAALGLFSATSAGTPAIGLALVTPILLSLWGARHFSSFRAAALGLPLPALVAVHAGRILGVFFVLLFGAGRLPPTFALTAGWGDILVAVTALPLAWAIHQRVHAWQPLTFAWNLFGFADLLTAVTLGVGSAADSPARFIFEAPGSNLMGSLPWVLVPGLLVPLYLLTHFAVFVQLVRGPARISRSAIEPPLTSAV
jgi:hypothetical protein